MRIPGCPVRSAPLDVTWHRVQFSWNPLRTSLTSDISHLLIEEVTTNHWAHWVAMGSGKPWLLPSKYCGVHGMNQLWELDLKGYLQEKLLLGSCPQHELTFGSNVKVVPRLRIASLASGQKNARHLPNIASCGTRRQNDCKWDAHIFCHLPLSVWSKKLLVPQQWVDSNDRSASKIEDPWAPIKCCGWRITPWRQMCRFVESLSVSARYCLRWIESLNKHKKV